MSGVWYQIASSTSIATPPTNCTIVYETYNKNDTLTIRSESYNIYKGKKTVNWYGLVTEGKSLPIKYTNYIPGKVLKEICTNA